MAVVLALLLVNFDTMLLLILSDVIIPFVDFGVLVQETIIGFVSDSGLMKSAEKLFF